MALTLRETETALHSLPQSCSCIPFRPLEEDWDRPNRGGLFALSLGNLTRGLLADLWNLFTMKGKIKMRKVSMLVLGLLFGLSSVAVFAQQPTGSIEGTV